MLVSFLLRDYEDAVVDAYGKFRQCSCRFGFMFSLRFGAVP